MSYTPTFKPGDWLVECMRCGRMFKGSELLRTWDGLYVCQEDWEPKHPQLTVRGVQDITRTPWSSPEPPDVFTDDIGYWTFTLPDDSDQDYSQVGFLDCYCSPTGESPKERFSNDAYVEGTT